MNEILSKVIDNAPSLVGMVILVRLLFWRIAELHKDIKEIRHNCDARLKWCIDHFGDDHAGKEKNHESTSCSIDGKSCLSSVFEGDSQRRSEKNR